MNCISFTFHWIQINIFNVVKKVDSVTKYSMFPFHWINLILDSQCNWKRSTNVCLSLRPHNSRFFINVTSFRISVTDGTREREKQMDHLDLSNDLNGSCELVCAICFSSMKVARRERESSSLAPGNLFERVQHYDGNPSELLGLLYYRALFPNSCVHFSRSISLKANYAKWG